MLTLAKQIFYAFINVSHPFLFLGACRGVDCKWLRRRSYQPAIACIYRRKIKIIDPIAVGRKLTHVAYRRVLAAELLRVGLCAVCCISFFRWWCCRTPGCRWTGKTDGASVACGTFSWERLPRRGLGRESAIARLTRRSSSRPFVFGEHSPHYLL